MPFVRLSCVHCANTPNGPFFLFAFCMVLCILCYEPGIFLHLYEKQSQQKPECVTFPEAVEIQTELMPTATC